MSGCPPVRPLACSTKVCARDSLSPAGRRRPLPTTPRPLSFGYVISPIRYPQFRHQNRPYRSSNQSVERNQAQSDGPSVCTQFADGRRCRPSATSSCVQEVGGFARSPGSTPSRWGGGAFEDRRRCLFIPSDQRANTVQLIHHYLIARSLSLSAQGNSVESLFKLPTNMRPPYCCSLRSSSYLPYVLGDHANSSK